MKIVETQDTITALKAWYDTPLGTEILNAEQRLVEQALARVQGNRLLQVTLDGRRWFCEHARATHGVLLAPQLELGMDQHSIIATHEELPVQSAVIDILVMHHVLEFSEDPHQVLREAARILRPGGHLLLVVFNPASFWGVHSRLRRRDQAPWSGRLISQSRLQDWFRLLQLSPLLTESRGYCYPLENDRWRNRLRWLRGIPRHLPLAAGNVMLMMARKDVGGMTAIRPEWNKRLLGGLQVIESKARRTGIRRNQS